MQTIVAILILAVAIYVGNVIRDDKDDACKPQGTDKDLISKSSKWNRR